VDCDHLELLIEGLADGTLERDAETAAHLETCARCRARVEQAREIDRYLMTREAPAPAATFTAGVMALVNDERWKTERVVDLGFNLAMAAGILVILAGGAGLAWSLGFLTVTIDLDALAMIAQSQLGNSNVMSQVQTIAMAAVLLTMVLALWWWAEADSSF
jgi:anti-sigma factor RsiW